MSSIQLKFRYAVIAAILFSVSSCTLKYSDAAYHQDTSIKTEAVQLFSKSGDAYTNHSAEADTLRAHIRQAIAFESSRTPGKNKITVQMWKSLADTSQGLEHDLKRWQAAPIAQPLRNDIDTIVGQMFDRIIELELARPH